MRVGVIDDLGRRHVEFDDLIKALQLQRRYAETRSFSVLLNMVDASITTLSFHEVEASYLPLHNGTSKFNLILELDLDERNSSFSFEFPTQLFETSTINRLGDGLVTLLKDIVAQPDAAISDLQVLSPSERERLLEWGGRDIGNYEEGSPANVFEQRVRERPSDVALVFGDETVTYADLNIRSNQLARKLRLLGCAEDDVVAVFCERSPKVIVGILAVQKAGAAHLPLDPFYPAARTSQMLLNSGARFLISDRDISDLKFGGIVISPTKTSAFSPANLGVSRRPESIAYVPYTSGTTGGPKGVMIGQRNLMTLVRRATSALALDHRDVWTLFHSVCFDVSVWEMFGALLTGARLVIVPRQLAADPDRLLHLIEENQVSVLCQPPSAFYLLADSMVRAERPTSIRYAVLGGEAIKTANLREWHERYGAGSMLVNGYGITETTVYSTFKVLTRREIFQRGGSIGRPLPGTYVYIFNPELRLCPVGVIGELYIGGLGVGLGYLGQPELTRNRSIDDPLRPAIYYTAPAISLDGCLTAILNISAEPTPR